MDWLMDWLTDPSEFDPLVFVVLVALTILLTLGSIVWLVLEREEPSARRGTSDDAAAAAEYSSPLARIAARSEREAARVRREMDADAGRGSDARGGARR
ncbi:hypothetical protein [Brachybacterium sp. ACRRE]|uniref:hypothetical protein n=1 Tax=Brachybacterium sp. ACRRE TaxID=2918184 RepID=UPI001EF3425E|nr:hypothetical protein [Brachybacterium sp. ACRRE]MCG7309374.1 hypothetical protein [Brachybacterium sp. ACRRE]